MLPLDTVLAVSLLAPIIAVISTCLIRHGALRRRAPFPVLFFPGLRVGFMVRAPVWGGFVAVVVALGWSAYVCWMRGAVEAAFVVTLPIAASSILTAREDRDSPGQRATGNVPVALVGTVALYNALIEELLIRWVPWALWRVLTGDVIPMVIYVPATAVLFGLWHVHTQTWKAVPWKLTLGLAWGWLAWSYGLGVSCLSHLAYNSVGLLTMDKRFRPASLASESAPGLGGPRRG